MLNTFQPYNLESHGVRLPSINISNSEKEKLKLQPNVTNFDYLWSLCDKGFEDKLLKGKIKPEDATKYAERRKWEMETFQKLNLIDYVLLVHDVLSWCTKNEIPKGPARGCLSGDSKVLINGGYHPIKNAFLGKTINSNGKIDDIINLHKYKCDEKLVSFKTYYSTPYNPAFTLDHKILCLKNPFGKRTSVKQGVTNLKSKLHQFNKQNLKWVPASEIKKDDYLVRYIGRQSNVIDINIIDLARFSDKYDDQYVYEQHNSNKNPLNVNTISLNTGLSRNYLISLKRNKLVTFRSPIKRKILDDYLLSINKTFDDFVKNTFHQEIKYDRYLKVTDAFCYVLGFYIGDGWIHEGRSIGFAFHSENNKNQLELIKTYFSRHLIRSNKHRNKKLIQFYVKSKIFAGLFRSLVPDNCSTKKIPLPFLDLPDKKLKALFKGLIDSDGHSRVENGSIRKCFDNTSIELIYQVRRLAEYFGYMCSLSKRNQKGCSESYKVSFQERKKYTTTGFNDGEYVYIKVRDIKDVVGDGYVYDLSVKDEPSYHTDNFIVHNSSACSLVLYLIGCTNIDPIEYGLYFTRFVSEARAKSKIVDGITYVQGKSMPDVDQDIGYYKKDKVVKYVEEKYRGKTAKIGTQSCLTGKLLIKEVAKIVLEYSEDETKTLANLIEKHYGVVERLEDAYYGNEIKEIQVNVEFKNWVDALPENQECFRIACSLQDIIKNKGIHPSGVAISFDNIDNLIPLELSSSKDIITSYNMDEVATQVVKLDILGLKTVDVIDVACKLINKNPEDINPNHESIYQYLSSNDRFYGLFQIEEGLSKKVVVDVQPRNIHDLAACISISRPGALAYIPNYRKFVREGIKESFHPEIDKCLELTGNIIVYQEQINRICMEVYKMSPTDSDEVRRCIAKKLDDEIDKWEPKVYEAGKKQNIPEEVTEKFWKTIKNSGKYLFNSGHAYSYGTVTAQTTYLKANHPQQFFLSLLKMSKYEPNPIEVISKIQQELRYFNIELLPPHILHSGVDFKIEGNDIRFGLGSVKGISEKTIEKLNKFRTPHSNKFEVFLGAKEAGLSIGVLSSLIHVGTLDMSGQKRSKLVYEAQLFNLLTLKEKQLCIQFGGQFNYDLVKCLKHILTLKDEKGKPLIKETRYKTIKKHQEDYKKMFEYNSKNDKLCTYCHEKVLLGYSYSVKLIDIYKEVAPDLITIEEVNGCLEREKVHFVGEAVEIISRKGKESGRKYLKVLVQDQTSSVWTMLNDSERENKIEIHKEDNGRIVKENDIVSCRGVKGSELVFADRIGIQEKPIIFRTSEIKEENK